MTVPQLRRGAEKWKTKSRFPTFPLSVFLPPTNQKGGLAADRFAPAFRLILGLENAGASGPFSGEERSQKESATTPNGRSQPIRLLILPVKVRSRELTVCPRSHIRHLLEVTWEVKART